jgi:1,4-dihydroxy-6-naphthoate synthase
VTSLAISPCPNDTFAFYELVESGRYDVTLDDVEALNRRALRGEFDVTKISVAAFPAIADRYALLRAGGAAGYGVGPLLVAATDREPGGRIAIPGEHTTAAFLLRRLGDFETVEMRFDLIEDAVLSGAVDAGVLIHEGRFTYASKGLVMLRDLGDTWEGPLPLGAIAIRRDLGAGAARSIDAEIRASVERARGEPARSAAFVREHAQELAPDVIKQHIELYVNDYTLALDEEAVLKMTGRKSSDVFAYQPRPDN